MKETKEYHGVLPEYAKNADRKRVVKILCRGKCKNSRWAEMNENYPGKEILMQASLFKFFATCLKCGYRAKDPYNWIR